MIFQILFSDKEHLDGVFNDLLKIHDKLHHINEKLAIVDGISERMKAIEKRTETRIEATLEMKDTLNEVLEIQGKKDRMEEPDWVTWTKFDEEFATIPSTGIQTHAKASFEFDFKGFFIDNKVTVAIVGGVILILLLTIFLFVLIRFCCKKQQLKDSESGIELAPQTIQEKKTPIASIVETEI
jgi:hypothetical protein